MSNVIAAIVAWHVVAGLLAIIFDFPGRHPLIRQFRATDVVVWAPAGICALTGILMVAAAAAGMSVGRFPGLLEIHIGAGILACLAWVAPTIVRHVLPRRKAPAIAAILLLVSSAAMAALSYQADRYFRVLTATTASQARNPLFPAGSVLNPHDNWRTPPSRCGDSGCHPRAHQDWADSPHAGSYADPEYQKALSRTVRKHGVESGRWCAGCHDPASLRPGSTASGIDCLSCHAMSEVPLRVGGGYAVYSKPDDYPFGLSESRYARGAHGFLLRLRPLPHKASQSGPSGGPNLTCAPCHRLPIGAAQNDYGHLLYDDTWGQWHNSPYSSKTAHAFSEIPPARTCRSCHSPHAGTDAATKLATLQRSLSIRIFALQRRPAGSAAPRIETPLPGRAIPVQPGERISIEVVMRNLGIGHAFPTGSPDSRTAWIEVTIADENGRLRGKADVENGGAHRFGMIALDSTGSPVAPGAKNEIVAGLHTRPDGAGQGYAPHYRAIQSGEAALARYSFTVPRNSRRLQVRARLQYRGSGPADTIGVDEMNLSVGQPYKGPPRLNPSSSDARGDSADAGSQFAYGVALFNRDDPLGARRAFQNARTQNPGDPEAWIAIARTFLQEGDLLSARLHLDRALALSPDSPRARAWKGRTLRVMGRYEEALRILEPLARSFPEDSLTWFDIGLARFRLGRFVPAVEAFQRVLEIVPDDAGAHLNLMLCYRRLMRLSDARREEAIYRNLRSDSRPNNIIERYIATNPSEAREASPNHEHVINLAP